MRKRKRCRSELPTQHVLDRGPHSKIRKQEKNMCVANAVTTMNEFRCGYALDVKDCYTKNMSQSGERLFKVIDKLKNKRRPHLTGHYCIFHVSLVCFTVWGVLLTLATALL